MASVLNLDALNAASVKAEPYPYFAVERSISAEAVTDIIRDFPKINDGGSYNLDDVTIGPQFQQLLDSIDSKEFRKILCEKVDVDVMDLPMLMTLRGHSRKKDGRIHSDSKSKVLTILIYLNESWPASTGKLRILRDKNDMENFVEEIDPGPGNLLAFKVTDNGWHGYPSFEGKRQSIQINFLTSEGAASKHKFFHNLSARFKKFKNRDNDMM